MGPTAAIREHPVGSRQSSCSTYWSPPGVLTTQVPMPMSTGYNRIRSCHTESPVYHTPTLEPGFSLDDNPRQSPSPLEAVMYLWPRVTGILLAGDFSSAAAPSDGPDANLHYHCEQRPCCRGGSSVQDTRARVLLRWSRSRRLLWHRAAARCVQPRLAHLQSPIASNRWSRRWAGNCQAVLHRGIAQEDLQCTNRDEAYGAPRRRGHLRHRGSDSIRKNYMDKALCNNPTRVNTLIQTLVLHWFSSSPPPPWFSLGLALVFGPWFSPSPPSSWFSLGFTLV